MEANPLCIALMRRGETDEKKQEFPPLLPISPQRELDLEKTSREELTPRFSTSSKFTSKCRHPNCRSTTSYTHLVHCFMHMTTHGPKRYTCSKCQCHSHQISNLKRHLRTKGCKGGKITDKIDERIVDEWINLADMCFPNESKRLEELFAQELAKSQNLEPSKAKIKMREFTTAYQEAISPLMSNVNCAKFSGTHSTFQTLAQLAGHRPTLFVHNVKAEETSNQISEEDYFQQMRQEVKSLKAEKQILLRRLKEAQNCNEIVKKLLGEKDIAIELQKETIHQLKESPSGSL